MMMKESGMQEDELRSAMDGGKKENVASLNGAGNLRNKNRYMYVVLPTQLGKRYMVLDEAGRNERESRIINNADRKWETQSH